MDLQRRLEPQLKAELRHLPLPLLLARLSLVTLPVAELQHTLESLLGDNPLFSLAPPNLPSRGPSIPADDIEHAPDMDEELRLQLAACPALRGLDGAAAALPQCLDVNGRLTVADDELAELLGLSLEDASLLLAAVRDWVEPPGLFARDLTEAARAGKLAFRAVLTMITILWCSSLMAAFVTPALLSAFPMPVEAGAAKLVGE